MGYLSDIYFITNQEGYSLIVQDADAQSIVNVANSIEVNKEKDYVLVIWQSIKWYPMYPPIRSFMDLLWELEEQGIPYRFIRLEEEFGDVDDIGNTDKANNCFPEIRPVQSD